MIAAIYGLLRFDALAVPAFVATGGMRSTSSRPRCERATPRRFVDAAVAIGVVVLVAWSVTRYLAQARAAAAGTGAAATGSSPSTE